MRTQTWAEIVGELERTGLMSGMEKNLVVRFGFPLSPAGEHGCPLRQVLRGSSSLDIG